MYQRQIPFGEAVTRAMTVNYCNFSGRSSRSEYWWFALFTFLISCVIGIIFSSTLAKVISMLVGLAFLLPNLGLAVRRLHDIGKSGWWYLIGFIPLIGVIILIVWFCRESQPFDNEYGAVPNVA